MAEAVDLDDMAAGAGDPAHVIATPAHHQAALVLVETVEVHDDEPVPHLQPVALAADLRHHKDVGLPLVVELDAAADDVAGTRSAAACGGQERRAVERLLGVVHVDRHAEQGDVGVPGRRLGQLGADAVEPLGVGLAGDHLGAIEQVEQERLGRRAALDEHGRLAQGATQAGQCLATITAPGDHLGHHRVVVGRNHLAGGDAGVDPDAGPGWQVQQGDGAGGGCETFIGVLGVEPDLDGVPNLWGHRSGQLFARCHQELQLDQVESGGGLGDRVLHLEPGVHLHERERLVLRLVKELDRARTAVTGGRHQRDRRPAELGLLLVAEHRGAGLFDQLLVAPLDGAVADAGRPDRAVRVGDDLHLDVATTTDEALHEDDRIAERIFRLGLGAFEREHQLIGRSHDPDAPAASAAPSLDHERVPDGVRMSSCVLRARHRSTAPRGYRNTGLLGQQLGLDLVAELPHGLRRWTDEDQAQAFAELREGRVLGHEAPTHPHRIGPADP